jgi:drug/metabolite transporter (DMT)-like permease
MNASDPSTQRARKFLYVLGTLFIVLGVALFVPPLAEEGTDHAGVVCMIVGTLLFTVAKFGSERFVRRCESLLTGWP